MSEGRERWEAGVFFAATSLVPDNGTEVIAGVKGRWPLQSTSGCDCKPTLSVGSGSDHLSLIGLYCLTLFAFHIQSIGAQLAPYKPVFKSTNLACLWQEPGEEEDFSALLQILLISSGLRLRALTPS